VFCNFDCGIFGLEGEWCFVLLTITFGLEGEWCFVILGVVYFDLRGSRVFDCIIFDLESRVLYF